VLAGFFVGWLVRLCLRWFRVCFSKTGGFGFCPFGGMGAM